MSKLLKVSYGEVFLWRSGCYNNPSVARSRTIFVIRSVTRPGYVPVWLRIDTSTLPAAQASPRCRRSPVSTNRSQGAGDRCRSRSNRCHVCEVGKCA